jgi:hypothetical protein
MPTPEPPSYFSFTRDEQSELLQGAANRAPWSTKMLEKDVWVVWTLATLFRQPNAPRYAFKGGTCLSKVYGAIHRFSEDIDITLDPDHPTYVEGLDPSEAGVTKNRLKKRGDLARARLPDFLTSTLVPYLRRCALLFPEHSRPTVDIEDAGEGRVRVRYPSALEPSVEPPYIAENVLLELGARASTEPSQTAEVRTFLSELPELEGNVAFPTATVRALSIVRTFWEKVTLIHFENTRNDRAGPAERYARHWYDLHALSQRPGLVDMALVDDDTLRLVLRVKHAHYGGKGVRYEDCGTGHLRLATTNGLRIRLEHDYDQMIAANMFVRPPPAFADVTEHLEELESKLNAHLSIAPVTTKQG